MKRNDAARSKLLAHDAMIENEPEKRCRVGEREKIKSHLRLRDVDERPKLRQQNVIIQGEIPLLEQTLSKLKVSFWCWCGCCRCCCCCVYSILIARLFVFSSFCGLFLSASSLLLLLLPFLACCQCETSKS